MKKLGLILVIMLIMEGCSFANSEVANQNAEVSAMTEDINKEELDTEKKENIENEIVSVLDNSDEWSKILASEGKLIADFNQDGNDDFVQIEYKITEGSQVISKLELNITGVNEPYIIEDYDASFVKLEVFDIDGDNSDEIFLLFDTHGGGGQGTHDLYLIKILDDTLAVTKLDGYVESTIEIDESWNVDGIYDIEKVLYKGIQKLLVRQYVWGEQGHSDEKGDMASFVTQNDDNLIATESWMVLAN